MYQVVLRRDKKCYASYIMSPYKGWNMVLKESGNLIWVGFGNENDLKLKRIRKWSWQVFFGYCINKSFKTIPRLYRYYKIIISVIRVLFRSFHFCRFEFFPIKWRNMPKLPVEMLSINPRWYRWIGLRKDLRR